MSIYSGFGTRKEEEKYNKLLTRLIETLQVHILTLTNGKIDLEFYKQYQQILFKLTTLEEHKYLPPKFTNIMETFMSSLTDNVLKYSKTERQKPKSAFAAMDWCR